MPPQTENKNKPMLDGEGYFKFFIFTTVIFTLFVFLSCISAGIALHLASKTDPESVSNEYKRSTRGFGIPNIFASVLLFGVYLALWLRTQYFKDDFIRAMRSKLKTPGINNSDLLNNNSNTNFQNMSQQLYN